MASHPEKKKKRKLRRWLLLLLFALLVLAAVRLFVLPRLRSENAVTYQPYTATVGSITNALNFTGTLQLIDSQTCTASAASTVRKIYVAEGDAVHEGDKLIRLSNGQTCEADFDGTVNRVYVKADEDVSAGDELVQTADFSHLKVTVRVDEYDIESVQVGQECRVVTTANDRSFESSIASIDYIASAGNGSVANYSVEAYVDVDGPVWPGMQVTLTVPQSEAIGVVVLKEEALSFDPANQAYVWKYGADGALRQVPVEVGVTNGNYVEIVSGIEDGETVYAPVQDSELSMFPFAMMGQEGSGARSRGNSGGQYAGGASGRGDPARAGSGGNP